MLGITPEGKEIGPFSLNQFLMFLQSKSGVDAYRYLANIQRLINKLTENAILIPCGINYNDPPFLKQCYYSNNELSKAQKTNSCWLGKILGLGFLKFKYEPFMVRIEGESSEGVSGTGSGIIADNLCLCDSWNIRAGLLFSVGLEGKGAFCLKMITLFGVCCQCISCLRTASFNELEPYVEVLVLDIRQNNDKLWRK